MENKKISTVADYNKGKKLEAQINLASGHIFKIKKLTQRDFAENGIDSFLESARTLYSETEERRSAMIKKMTAKEKADNIYHQDMIVCLGCIQPVVSMEKKPDAIHIKELDDIDYYQLIGKVMKFARGTLRLDEFGSEVEEVSPDKQSGDTGQSGATV